MSKFEHTVGSHSDDRGGDSDRRCDCQDNRSKELDEKVGHKQVLWKMRREGELRVYRDNKELFPHFKDEKKYTMKQALSQLKETKDE